MEMIQAVKLLYTLKMKSLTLFFSLFLMLPLSVFAQSAGELLQKVSEALSEGKDDYAVSLFRQSADAGVDLAEMFYWANVDKNTVVASRLANELAAHYKEMRNYDKDYEKVLMLDGDNLQANIFLGNYFYLQAEKERKKLDDDFKKITSPTRMQYARYRNGLSDVLTNSYSKAKTYLQRVLQVFPSMEAGNTLERIKKMEAEMR